MSTILGVEMKLDLLDTDLLKRKYKGYLDSSRCSLIDLCIGYIRN